MNSINESLYFNVPLVMFPETSEQRGVCERVCQLGAGIKGEKLSLYGAVNKVISDADYRKNAEKISEGLKKTSGAKGAADKILSVCR